MRHLLNFLGGIALVGLIFALAPSSSAIAGKTKTNGNDSSGGCGGSTGNTPSNPNCDCMPLTTFTASGSGEAVDDLAFFDVSQDYSAAMGCYIPPAYQSSYPDPLAPNDNPELLCPSSFLGVSTGANFSCGCLIAGSDVPSGDAVNLVGDAQHGNWTVRQLEVSYTFADNTTQSSVGDQNGTGPGTYAGRCFGASGFVVLESAGSAAQVPADKDAYFKLQGTVCDSIPSSSSDGPPQGSFTGSFVLDQSLSNSFFANWASTGTFVITLNAANGAPAYGSAEFAFNGYMQSNVNP